MSRALLICELAAGRLYAAAVDAPDAPGAVKICEADAGLIVEILLRHTGDNGVLPAVAAAATHDEKMTALAIWVRRHLDPKAKQEEEAAFLKAQAKFLASCGGGAGHQAAICAVLSLIAETEGMRGAIAEMLNALASLSASSMASGVGSDVDLEAMLERALDCWRKDKAAINSGVAPPSALAWVQEGVAPGLEGAVPQGRA